MDCQLFKHRQQELVQFLCILKPGALFIPKRCADLTRAAFLQLCGHKLA